MAYNPHFSHSPRPTGNTPLRYSDDLKHKRIDDYQAKDNPYLYWNKADLIHYAISLETRLASCSGGTQIRDRQGSSDTVGSGSGWKIQNAFPQNGGGPVFAPPPLSPLPPPRTPPKFKDDRVIEYLEDEKGFDQYGDPRPPDRNCSYKIINVAGLLGVSVNDMDNPDYRLGDGLVKVITEQKISIFVVPPKGTPEEEKTLFNRAGFWGDLHKETTYQPSSEIYKQAELEYDFNGYVSDETASQFGDPVDNNIDLGRVGKDINPTITNAEELLIFSLLADFMINYPETYVYILLKYLSLCGRKTLKLLSWELKYETEERSYRSLAHAIGIERSF